jgi:hypothetical protein
VLAGTVSANVAASPFADLLSEPSVVARSFEVDVRQRVRAMLRDRPRRERWPSDQFGLSTGGRRSRPLTSTVR